MLEKIYNEYIYWNILFLSSNFLDNLNQLRNLVIYKKYKKWRKRRIAWKWKFRKKRKKFKLKRFRSKLCKNYISLCLIRKIKQPANRLNILSCSTLTLRGINKSYIKLFHKDNKSYYKKKFIRRFLKMRTLTYNDSFFNFKEDIFRIYFRNYYRKPYWKLRKSRILHWGFFFTKTIRKRRYRGFIMKFMKKSLYKAYIITQLLAIFCRLKFSFNAFFKTLYAIDNVWLHTNNVIFMLPRFIKKQWGWFYFKKKKKKLWKKTKRWAFLNYKRSNYPWLTRKKNFPKFLKKKMFKNESLNFSRLFYDTFSKSFALCRAYVNFYHFQYFMFEHRSFLLKLHMFRYRS